MGIDVETLPQYKSVQLSDAATKTVRRFKRCKGYTIALVLNQAPRPQAWLNKPIRLVARDEWSLLSGCPRRVKNQGGRVEPS